MFKAKLFNSFIYGSVVILLFMCSGKVKENKSVEKEIKNNNISVHELKIVVGAEQTELYINDLIGKRVGVVSNQTSVIGNVHIVDSLIALGVNVKRVFAPEHGFRGNHDAGAIVAHGKDIKTGLPIYSLHGKTKKPSKESLNDIDVLLFDIQDVGVRFYTYISTLHYVMEAAAENNKELIVLDRPNPNAHYIDGPVLKSKFKSFVGMHPVPVVYGLTIGEYAKMINGEKWLKDSVIANLRVVPLLNWNRNKEYILPIPPSPNLPNQLSIYLYPSLCFFEGTEVSVGRGTSFPFQVWGHPKFKGDYGGHGFTPRSIEGKSKYPKHENKMCWGEDFTGYPIDSIRKYVKVDFNYLESALNDVEPYDKFFNREHFFNLLTGNDTVLNHMKKYKKVGELNRVWENDLKEFDLKRQKYFIYNN